jgi:hypothetical protein
MQIFCSKAYTRFLDISLLNFIIFYSSSVFAQTNSPYSRYGIGDLMNQENISNRGMGGVSNADHSFGQINYLNPASYPSIGLTTLQLGLYGERNRVTTKDSSNTTGSLNIAYLSVGLPVGDKGGIAFGLMPFSRVGYRELASSNPFDSTIIQSAFTGSGGLQKLFAGYGWRYKDFSLGANFNFVFGNYSHSSINQFYDTTSIYSAEYGEYFNVKGVQFNFGGLYHHTFKKEGFFKDKILTIGATFQPQSSLSVNKDAYQKSFLYVGSAEDTIAKETGTRLKMTTPMSIGTGIQFAKGDTWKIGVDYNMAKWSAYRLGSDADSTTDSWNFKVGGAYRKTVLDNASFVNRMEYRAGFFTGQDQYKLNSTNIKSTGVSVGVGMPLKLRKSSYGAVNIALQTGVRGTIDNGLLREGFTRFSFGFSVSEKWFLKRRYD